MLGKPTPEGARDFLVPSPRLPGAVLRAAPVAADLQAGADGGGLRPLLPARPLLPRRGSARRPPARVHADRHRGVVRRARGHHTRSPRGCSARCGREAGHAVEAPFPRMAYRDAMERFGSDKPDLRFGLEISDVSDGFARPPSSAIARAALAQGGGGSAGSWCPAAPLLSRKQLDEFEAWRSKSAGAGLGWLTLPAAISSTGSAAKSFLARRRARQLRHWRTAASALFVVGAGRGPSPRLDRVRQRSSRGAAARAREGARVRVDRAIPALRPRAGHRRR